MNSFFSHSKAEYGSCIDDNSGDEYSAFHRECPDPTNCDLPIMKRIDARHNLNELLKWRDTKEAKINFSVYQVINAEIEKLKMQLYK